MTLKVPRNFLGVEAKYYDYQKSRFVVIPCPYEATTSFGKGTKKGPQAIIRASQEVEWFDEELGYEPYHRGWIYTWRPVTIRRLPSVVRQVVREQKIPVILGGEHSLTPLVVEEIKSFYRNLSVLQLDAHADLRDSYGGTKESHACAMRRVLEICPAVQVGIRSISVEEWEWANKTGQINKIHWAEKLELVEKIENQLSKDVYLTIDVDVFDPAAVPAVGTPEPGGMFWYEVLDVLKGVCTTKNIVGFDVVELSPRFGDLASPFTVAKLIYKIMGFLSIS